MNARQKAKHFKRLYEQGLPKKPYPVVYQSILPRHYRISFSLDGLGAKVVANLQCDQQRLRNYIENQILSELKPLIWNNLKVERDIYPDKFRYSLDIWFDS